MILVPVVSWRPFFFAKGGQKGGRKRGTFGNVKRGSKGGQKLVFPALYRYRKSQ